MSEEHEWAVIHQRLAAEYYRFSTQDVRRIGHNKAAIYQRLAADHYRAARRFMGLEGWE